MTSWHKKQFQLLCQQPGFFSYENMEADAEEAPMDLLNNLKGAASNMEIQLLGWKHKIEYAHSTQGHEARKESDC